MCVSVNYLRTNHLLLLCDRYPHPCPLCLLLTIPGVPYLVQSLGLWVRRTLGRTGDAPVWTVRSSLSVRLSLPPIRYVCLSVNTFTCYRHGPEGREDRVPSGRPNPPPVDDGRWGGGGRGFLCICLGLPRSVEESRKREWSKSLGLVRRVSRGSTIKVGL